jgi:hypothetical protein
MRSTTFRIQTLAHHASNLLLAGLLAGCAATSSESDEAVRTRLDALTGNITISGQVVDANGAPKAGVRVALNGSVQRTATTNASGNYAFSALSSGSYSVRPTLTGCSFLPDVVNLNSLTASKVVSFGGSGAACGGNAKVNVGATTGPYAISGRVLDASGNALVGARVSLGGAVTAVRFTDYAGAYVFHVAAGNYNLAGGTECALTPSNANFNAVNGNRVRDFVGAGAACTVAVSRHIAATGRTLELSRGGQRVAAVQVSAANEGSAAAATGRLTELFNAGGVNLTIAGSPAVERVVLLPGTKLMIAEGIDFPEVLHVKTAIAFGSTVVRFDTQVPENTATETVNFLRANAKNYEPTSQQYFTARHGGVCTRQQRSAGSPNGDWSTASHRRGVGCRVRQQ